MSSNPKVLQNSIGVEQARGVLRAPREHRGHRFLTDDVSLADPDIPTLNGHRQVTGAHLLAIARRQFVGAILVAVILAG